MWFSFEVQFNVHIFHRIFTKKYKYEYVYKWIRATYKSKTDYLVFKISSAISKSINSITFRNYLSKANYNTLYITLSIFTARCFLIKEHKFNNFSFKIKYSYCHYYTCISFVVFIFFIDFTWEDKRTIFYFCK